MRRSRWGELSDRIQRRKDQAAGGRIAGARPFVGEFAKPNRGNAQGHPDADSPKAKHLKYLDISGERRVRIEHLAADRLLRGQLGDLRRQRLGDGRAQEPGRHHGRDDRRRRELGHGRQADRRQEQLARRVQQVEQRPGRSAAP